MMKIHEKYLKKCANCNNFQRPNSPESEVVIKNLFVWPKIFKSLPESII